MAILTKELKNYNISGGVSFNGAIGKLYLNAKYTEQSILNNKTYVYAELYIRVTNGYIGSYSGNVADMTLTGLPYKKINLKNGNFQDEKIMSIEGWVQHNEDGSKFIEVGGNTYFSPWGKGIQVPKTRIDLPNIPRESTITSEIKNGNIGDTINLTFDKKISTYYDVLVIKQEPIFETSVRNLNILKIVEDVNYNYEWIPSPEELQQTYNLIPTTKKCKYTYELTTYTDSSKTTQIGSTSIKSAEYTLINADPDFNDFSYANIDNTVSTVLDNDSSYFIKGVNKLQITIPVSSKAIAKKGATMSNYLVKWGEKTKSIPYADTEIIIAGDELINETTPILNVYAVDSRGNSKLVTTIITNWLNYSKPTLNNPIEVERTNDVEEETILSFKGKFWNNTFKTKNNTISATYQYKEKGDKTYINGTTNLVVSIENDVFMCNMAIKGDLPTGFIDTQLYDIRVYINDLPSSTPFTGDLSSGNPAMDIYLNNVSLGGAYNESLGGRVQINGKVYKEGGDGVPTGSTFLFDGDTIPDGYEEIEDYQPEYSTNEVRIGTWIDGKPLYRKLIQGTMSASATTNDVVIGVDNIDNYVKCDVQQIVKAPLTITYAMGTYYGNDADFMYCYLVNSTPEKVRTRCGATWPKRPFTYVNIVEYTKN